METHALDLQTETVEHLGFVGKHTTRFMLWKSGEATHADALRKGSGKMQ